MNDIPSQIGWKDLLPGYSSSCSNGYGMGNGAVIGLLDSAVQQNKVPCKARDKTVCPIVDPSGLLGPTR